MRKLFVILAIVFTVLGIAFTIAPMESIAYWPLGLGIVSAALAFKFTKLPELTDEEILKYNKKNPKRLPLILIVILLLTLIISIVKNCTTKPKVATAAEIEMQQTKDSMNKTDQKDLENVDTNADSSAISDATGDTSSHEVSDSELN